MNKGRPPSNGRHSAPPNLASSAQGGRKRRAASRSSSDSRSHSRSPSRPRSRDRSPPPRRQRIEAPPAHQPSPRTHEQVQVPSMPVATLPGSQYSLAEYEKNPYRTPWAIAAANVPGTITMDTLMANHPRPRMPNPMRGGHIAPGFLGMARAPVTTPAGIHSIGNMPPPNMPHPRPGGQTGAPSFSERAGGTQGRAGGAAPSGANPPRFWPVPLRRGQIDMDTGEEIEVVYPGEMPYQYMPPPMPGGQINPTDVSRRRPKVPSGGIPPAPASVSGRSMQSSARSGQNQPAASATWFEDTERWLEGVDPSAERIKPQLSPTGTHGAPAIASGSSKEAPPDFMLHRRGSPYTDWEDSQLTIQYKSGIGLSFQELSDKETGSKAKGTKRKLFGGRTAHQLKAHYEYTRKPADAPATGSGSRRK